MKSNKKTKGKRFSKRNSVLDELANEVDTVPSKKPKKEKTKKAKDTKEKKASNTSKKEKKEKKKPRKKLRAFLTIFLFFIFLGCIYGVITYFYQSHFFPGTTINGMNCEGLTVDNVKDKLQQSISKYELSIISEDGSKELLTGDMLGLTYVDDQGVEKLIKKQEPYLWILNLSKKDTMQVTTNITYEKEIVKMLVEELDCIQPENKTPPSNAYIHETESGWEIIPEVYGNTVKKEELITAICTAVDSGQTELNLKEQDLYEKPTILSDDENLNKQIETLNTLTQANLTYDFGDGRIYTIDRSLIKTWLVQAEDGTYSIDQTQVAAFVKQMARDTDTFGLAHEFKTSLGPTIQLAKGGDYGWVINRDATTANLVAEITAGNSGTIQPIYKYKGIARGINDIGGTYVEICIEQQKMWCYKDGNLVVETNVITGNHSTGYDTPSGSVWAIDAKKKDASFTLYDVDVTFWLPFNDQVGIHDASWRSAKSYKPDTYLRNGSHGCINTPYDAAEKIFNVMEIGYPVVVYYSIEQPVGPQPTKSTSIG